MSLITKVAKFARSPAGRKIADQAMSKAKDPSTRRKIESARAKLQQRGKQA
jgi:hypothetical protein